MACLCNTTALEIYRASGRLLPQLLERPRTGKLEGTCLPDRESLAHELRLLGAKTRPYRLMVGSKASTHRRDDVRCRVCSAALPPNALIRISDRTLITGPELTFLQLASNDDLDEVSLGLIACELCGTYVLDTSWDGLTNTDKPLTSVARIGSFLDQMPGTRGCRLARRALELAFDNSNSPMESALAMLLCAPRRYGGMGLAPARLNHPVRTTDGTRYVDLAFPKHKVGLEYKGKEYHSIEASERDDRRQNKVVGSGMTILNVWHEDLKSRHLFDQLLRDLHRAMGIRLRRKDDFLYRQDILRARLMPKGSERNGDSPYGKRAGSSGNGTFSEDELTDRIDDDQPLFDDLLHESEASWESD